MVSKEEFAQLHDTSQAVLTRCVEIEHANDTLKNELAAANEELRQKQNVVHAREKDVRELQQKLDRMAQAVGEMERERKAATVERQNAFGQLSQAQQSLAAAQRELTAARSEAQQ